MRRLPSLTASNAWPTALLILWAPVWFRSSRFSQMRAPDSSPGIDPPRPRGTDPLAAFPGIEAAGEDTGLAHAGRAGPVGAELAGVGPRPKRKVEQDRHAARHIPRRPATAGDDHVTKRRRR